MLSVDFGALEEDTLQGVHVCEKRKPVVGGKGRQSEMQIINSPLAILLKPQESN